MAAAMELLKGTRAPLVSHRWDHGAELNKTIWRTVGPDLLDLEWRERSRLTNGFSAWLDELTTGVTFVVCSRPVPVPAPQGSSTLERARHDHVVSKLKGNAAFQRVTHLVVPYLAPEAALSLVASLRGTCDVEGELVETLPPLAEGTWAEKLRTIRVGGLWLSSVRLERPPAVAVEAGWLSTLTGIGAAYDLAVRIVPRAAERADRGLRRRLRNLQAQELAISTVSGDPRVEVAMAATQRLRHLLATRTGNLFEIGATMTLVARSEVESAALVKEARGRGALLHSRWAPTWLDEVPARLETLAQPEQVVPSRLLVQTVELATMWPWSTIWEYPPANRSLLGRHQRTGDWVTVDPQSDADLPNGNLAVVAASGGGKSFLGGLLGIEAVRRGQSVVVLDPENEHRRWCAAVSGTYIDLAVGDGPGFNILELGSDQESAMGAVELLGLLVGTLNGGEKASFLEALERSRTRQPDTRPLLGDCVDLLMNAGRAQALGRRLSPWITGEPGLLFNRRGSGPEVCPLVCIGVRDLPSEWVPAATLLISCWLWDWIRRHNGPKLVMVDEAGLLADNAHLRRLMAHLSRRIRKYQGALLLLTQTGADLTQTEFGEVVAVNSATMLLGGQSQAGARRLQEAVSLDDPYRKWLQEVGRGSFLLVSGPRRIPVVVEAPGLYREWLGGESGAAAARPPEGPLAGHG